MDENNHQDWLNKGPWYNTSIFLKWHGSMIEYFITHARTDRYNLMCYLLVHDKMQPYCEDDESSLGDSSIPKDSTKKSLTELDATPNFIDIDQCSPLSTRCILFFSEGLYRLASIFDSYTAA